jgi:FkbM family methyltransferase
MAISAYLKKAVLAASLSRGRKITLAGKTYQMKGFFVNTLALKGRTGEREPWLDVVYETVFRCSDGAFLDIGANIGQTMLKVLSLDPSRRYIGFEPQVSCCFLIQHFLEKNAISNFATLPVGLSNENGTVKLYRGGEYDSTASTVKDFRPENFHSSYSYVCLRKGDELISELQVTSIAAIKIDVEGAELEVIEGLLETIEMKKPTIIFEVLNHFVIGTGAKLDDEHIRFRESRIAKMEDLLRRREYEIYNVLPGNRLKNIRKIVPPVSADFIRHELYRPIEGRRAFVPAVLSRVSYGWLIAPRNSEPSFCRCCLQRPAKEGTAKACPRKFSPAH